MKYFPGFTHAFYPYILFRLSGELFDILNKFIVRSIIFAIINSITKKKYWNVCYLFLIYITATGKNLKQPYWLTKYTLNTRIEGKVCTLNYNKTNDSPEKKKNRININKLNKEII
jgi:hypothetical protein